MALGLINFVAFFLKAYSSLGSADRPWAKEGSITSGLPTTGYEVLNHPDIKKIANKHGRSVAHVVLRWHLQMGGTAVAKSVTVGRIEDNFRYTSKSRWLCRCSQSDCPNKLHHISCQLSSSLQISFIIL